MFLSFLSPCFALWLWLLVTNTVQIFRATYTHQNNRIAVLMNGTLLGAIYTKVLQIPVAEAAKGAALTHISADLEGVTKGVTVIHNLWMSFVEIGFLTYFLYIYISYSCFLLFVAAICKSNTKAEYHRRSMLIISQYLLSGQCTLGLVQALPKECGMRRSKTA